MGSPTGVKLQAFLLDWLFKNLAGFDLPERMGDGVTYARDQRSLVKMEVSAAFKALKEKSAFAKIIGPKNAIRFGDLEDWEEKKEGEKGEKTTWEHVKPDKFYEVKFNEDAVSGIMWMMQVLMLPPVFVKQAADHGKEVELFSHMSVNPYQADRYVWPIVEALRKTKGLKDALGIKSERRRWADDDPDEESAKA